MCQPMCQPVYDAVCQPVYRAECQAMRQAVSREHYLEVSYPMFDYIIRIDNIDLFNLY